MLDRLHQNEVQRRQLLADVTHELRTPVAVLQGNLEAMVDGVYPADAEHLGPLVEETRLLSRLIDDLRTLSLAESGVLELHREPTDLGVLVGEVVAAFRAQAERGGVHLEADVPEEIPLAEIDPLRLREVLVNLTANALRHTPSGGEVRIAVAAEAVRLRFSVADTGSGIAPRTCPMSSSASTRRPISTGSGLGLAIARNLVLAHSGEIQAESTVGARNDHPLHAAAWTGGGFRSSVDGLGNAPVRGATFTLPVPRPALIIPNVAGIAHRELLPLCPGADGPFPPAWYLPPMAWARGRRPQWCMTRRRGPSTCGTILLGLLLAPALLALAGFGLVLAAEAMGIDTQASVEAAVQEALTYAGLAPATPTVAPATPTPLPSPTPFLPLAVTSTADVPSPTASPSPTPTETPTSTPSETPTETPTRDRHAVPDAIRHGQLLRHGARQRHAGRHPHAHPHAHGHADPTSVTLGNGWPSPNRDPRGSANGHGRAACPHPHADGLDLRCLGRRQRRGAGGRPDQRRTRGTGTGGLQRRQPAAGGGAGACHRHGLQSLHLTHRLGRLVGA